MYDPGMTTGTKVDVALCLMKPKPNSGMKRVFEPIEDDSEDDSEDDFDLDDSEAEWSEPEEEATNEDHDYVPVPKKSKKISPAPSKSGIAPNDKSTNFDPLEGSSTGKKFKFKKLTNDGAVKSKKSPAVIQTQQDVSGMDDLLEDQDFAPRENSKDTEQENPQADDHFPNQEIAYDTINTQELISHDEEVLVELTCPVVNSNTLPEESTVLAKRPQFKRPNQTIQNRSPAKDMRTPLRDIGNEIQDVTKGTLLFNYDYSLPSMNY